MKFQIGKNMTLTRGIMKLPQNFDPFKILPANTSMRQGIMPLVTFFLALKEETGNCGKNQINFLSLMISLSKECDFMWKTLQL